MALGGPYKYPGSTLPLLSRLKITVGIDLQFVQGVHVQQPSAFRLS